MPISHSTLDSWVKNIHPDDKESFLESINEHVVSHEMSHKSEYRVIDRDGNIVWIEAHGIAQFDENGEMTGMIGSHSDITAHKEYSDKLFNLAYIDQATGVYNRKMLLEKIQQNLEMDSSSTLVVFDFYMSKQLISIYGQKMSDVVFARGCEILESIIGSWERIFRVTTSKYAVLIDGHISSDELKKLSNHLKNDIALLTEEFDLRAKADFTTAVLQYPISEEDLTSHEILDRAFLTIEDANKQQVGSFSIYSDEARNRVVKSIHIETNLRQSIKLNELYTTYQPIIDSHDSKLIGFEALVRWDNPDWGIIYPDEFIPTSEKKQEYY